MICVYRSHILSFFIYIKWFVFFVNNYFSTLNNFELQVHYIFLFSVSISIFQYRHRLDPKSINHSSNQPINPVCLETYNMKLNMERPISEKKQNYRTIKCWLKKRDTVVTNSAKVESAKKKCLVALENTLAMLVYAVHSDSLKWARLSTKRQVLLWLFSWGESINRSGKIYVNKSFKHPSEIASIWSINQSGKAGRSI